MELHSLARNPVPSGAVAGSLAADDGRVLRFAHWPATRGPQRGTVVICPGRGEPIEKYFEVIADLRRRGFAAAIHDWRGQGGSERALADRRKGYVRSFREYDRDLARFMRDVVARDCPAPYIGLGHSMGGNILIRNATASPSPFDRMVLSAPMLAFHDGKVPVPQGLARFYAELLGWGPFGRSFIVGGNRQPEEAKGFENNVLTSDIERFSRNRQILDAAPDLALGSPTIAWVRAAYRSCRMLMHPEFANKVRVPMLLIAAGQDRIVSSDAIEKFAGRLKIGARVVLGGARHEILHETDEVRERFWAAFDAYLGSGSFAQSSAR